MLIRTKRSINGRRLQRGCSFPIFENQELYFNNYQNALNAYKNNIDLISGVSVIYKREFIYSFIVDGSVINYYWTNDEELKEIATEIYYKYRGEFI